MVQAEAPVKTPLYEPTLQAVHTVDAVALVTFPNVPPAQAVHKNDEDAAAKEPYMPAVQLVQTEVPVDSPL